MRIWPLALLPLVAASMTAVSAAPQSNDADRAALTMGVTAIGAPDCLPGGVVAYGEDSFTIVSGKAGNADVPVFAAARYGKGRIVAGGHEGFFGDRALHSAGNATFAANIAGWVANKPLEGLRVLTVDQSDGLQDTLTKAGVVVVNGAATDLVPLLKKTDEIWLNEASLDGKSELEIRALRNFVKSGGGVVVTGPAWGWLSEHPGCSIEDDLSANRIVIPMGLAFADGTVDQSSPGGFKVGADSLTSVPDALSALQDLCNGKRTLTAQESDQVTTILGQAVAVLPDSSPEVRKIEDLCENHGASIPSTQSPITSAMALARMHCFVNALSYRTLPASKIPADPSASVFPGPVPLDAKREHATIATDTRIPNWHGTGLYAIAGQAIAVTIPESASTKGLSVRIGSQTDTLWQADKWSRFPEISMSRPLTASTTLVASAFGGAVYIVVPEHCGAGTINVSIDGAVAAPRFVRGVTTNDDWKKTIRNAPGPWAELQGHLVTISVPSSAVRSLDDPDALMAHWDSMMEDCYAFFSAPKRPRQERYSADRQISLGYMHSGYPIMTHEDVAGTFCDLKTLTGRNALECWGFYHEMGHNFQRPEWTWSDFGEVTNNLFSLYESEKMNGAMAGAHPEMTLAKIGEREHEIAEHPGQERYSARDPWYGLTMFWLLRHEFGWSPFTELFAEFRGLSDSAKPHTELEKHNQFLVRFSKLTGHNLTQYLSAWGVETTPQAQSEVSSLPDWMPADWK